MDKNTKIANVVTIGGVALALGIAQLTLPWNLAIMTATCVGCYIDTKKQAEYKNDK